VVVEAHAPGLVGEKAGNGAVSLFDQGEAPQVRNPGVNQFVSYDAAAVEKKIFRRFMT
jgi:hypothetical protein